MIVSSSLATFFVLILTSHEQWKDLRFPSKFVIHVVHGVPFHYTILKYLSFCHVCVLSCGVEVGCSRRPASFKEEKICWSASCLPLAHRWMESQGFPLGVTCYRDCFWLCSENQQSLHCVRLRLFYPGTVHIRFVMDQVAPSTSIPSCHYHWIRAACPSGSACCCYQDNFLSSTQTPNHLEWILFWINIVHPFSDSLLKTQAVYSTEILLSRPQFFLT